MHQPYLLSALLLIFSFAIPAQATVVRMDIAIGGDQAAQEVYIELFDQQAPVTVTNFLKYIENDNGDRRYDGTFIHRSIPGFIVQGGGFAYDSASGPFSALVPHISVDAPITNEFDPSRSNLRGTVAMAKVGNDPDSATSEWFVNLADNSANLDNQNGGFTVFGRVLNPDMTIIDSIAALTTENQGGPFTALPVTRSASATSPTNTDLVVVNNVETVPTARIRTDVNELDFGAVPPGSVSSPRTIIIQNVGGTDLIIDGIVNPFAILPFITVRDECTSAPLPPAASCEMDLQFQPVSLGKIQNVTFILSNDAQSPSKAINVKGFGAFNSATLQIPPEFTEIDFGDILFSSEKSIDITLNNTGATDLIFSELKITGTDAAAFSIAVNNCTQLTPDQNSCTASVNFIPSLPGTMQATLEILSNDMNTPVATIPLSASASEDRDGIPDAIEAAAPNAGDGNRDGIPDILQDNVASLKDINGDYVTLESTIGTRLSTVFADDNPAPETTPATSFGNKLVFPHGFFSFFIEDVPPGGSASVTIHLPEGAPATDLYLKYSPITDSWFTFEFNPQTQTGAEINGNRITLHFVDGGRGDADFFPNGLIVDPGGPAIVPVEDGASSSGGGGGCSVLHKANRSTIMVDADFLILLALLLVYYRVNRRRLLQSLSR